VASKSWARHRLPPPPILDVAADRETVIVLTNPWHERDAPNLSESLGAQVFAPPPDDGGTGMRMTAQLFSAGDRLPSESRPSPGGSRRTTSCSGSRVIALSPSATPSSTAATASSS
jgi:hypothetical protein